MVIATGFFDGVHIGHRLVIEQLIDAARSRGDESLVVTFWPHPRTVLQQEARNFRLLTSMQEKVAMLKSLGVGRVEVIRFTKEFGALTTEQYLKDYLIGKYGARAIVLGYDNRMGSDAGGAESVRDTAERLGLDVIMTGKVLSGAGAGVSSTRRAFEACAGQWRLSGQGEYSRPRVCRHVQYRHPSYCARGQCRDYRDQYFRL